MNNTKTSPVPTPATPDRSSKIGRPWNLLLELEMRRGLLNVDDVAGLLGKSTCTVYRMAQQKKLPSLILGGERRFDPSVLSMYFAKRYPEMVAAAREIQVAV